MTLADYLAKNYLTADAPSDKKSKKRKRKQGTSDEGLIIADDDAIEWNNTIKTSHNDPEDGPVLVSGQTSDFRRAKISTWRTIGAPAPSSTEQAAADAIIASAAAEKAARAAAEKDDDNPAPAVVSTTDTANDTATLKMESGAHAGLQTAAQVSAALAAHEAAERARFESSTDALASGRNQETIYRDASGRVINIAMKRAEARRQAAEQEVARQASITSAQQGEVQKAERARRRERLEEERYAPLARYADDDRLNEELRRVDRWNDPAATFLTSKREGRSVTGKPLYKGAFMPNRYGIRPGYRWDGVDRGNGFEKEWFAARNRRRNVRELEYAWQMDE